MTQRNSRSFLRLALVSLALLAGGPGAHAAELLRNGNFADGGRDWYVVGAAFNVAAGQACVQVDKPGANIWDVLFGQSIIELRQGRRYVVSFTASARAPTTIRPLLQFDAAPWTTYFGQNIAVDSSPKAHRLEFTMTEKDDPKAAFHFQLGAHAATTVCVSQVSVHDASGAPATPVALATLSPAAVPGATEPLRKVRVNQLGYLPLAPKRATVATNAPQPLRWQLRAAGGQVVAEGRTRPFGTNRASGEAVHIADFSSVSTVGDGYVLVVDGEASHPFRIASDLYRRLKVDALNFFYQNRSGIAIEAALAGSPALARPAGHKPDRARCFSGRDEKGNDWPACDHELDVTGGWYDAGDHGKYVVNGGITVWTLQQLAERATLLRGADGSWFADGRIAVPEKGNGMPALLNEARWQMNFLLAMQVPDGRRLAVPVGDQRHALSSLRLSTIDAGGLVHHKVHDVSWTGIPTRPDHDTRPRHLYYPSTAATLNLAATAAQCARVWRKLDAAFSQRCLKAAERAWDAAARHPEIYAYSLFAGGGPYDDQDLSDEFYWAAVELFATTGHERYEKALMTSPRYLAMPTAGRDAKGDLYWAEVGPLATITLATVPTRLVATEIGRARDRVVDTARRYLAQIDEEGYLLPYAVDQYTWGSNANIINRAMLMGVAYDITRDPSLYRGVAEAMNYLLGRNPMDQSYISGYGERPLRNPHHRFWARQANADYPTPPPGLLSGGPNSVNFSDPVASKMKGRCINQTCWVDDIGAWTMNEIAINWNAPLVWVAAFLDEGLK